MSEKYDWDKHSTQNISRVMGSTDSRMAQAAWTTEQLRKMYQRLLCTRVDKLSTRVPKAAQRAAQLAAASNPPVEKIIDLIRHPNPSLELLELTKGFAKAVFHHSHCVPPAVSIMLYYLIIVVAMLRHDEKITTLGDEQLKEGIFSRMTEPWLDNGSAQLLQQALTKMQTEEDLLSFDPDASDVIPPRRELM